jgi:hypothetical protein
MTETDIGDVITRARAMRERAVAMQNYNARIQARLLEQSERLARLAVLLPRPIHHPRSGREGRP